MGPAALKPTNEFAEAVIKQLSPDGFFEERGKQLYQFGSAVHDAFYKGHVGDGEGPSSLFQCLMEFACRNKHFERTPGEKTALLRVYTSLKVSAAVALY